MPRSLPSLRSPLPLVGPGLHPLLHTRDYGEWEAVTMTALGSHHSQLLDASSEFSACFRGGSAGPLQMLHIQGGGTIRLEREQTGGGVLWLPLQGWTEEQVNGVPLIAEPGMAMLFRSGDQLVGTTSPSLEGLSFLLPPGLLPEGVSRPVGSALLGTGPLHRQLVAAAHLLAQAIAHQDACVGHAAQQILDLLVTVDEEAIAPRRSETRPRRRQRQLVADARIWMNNHLETVFRVADLADALQVPVRTLQASFIQELGHSPLTEAKLLRLRRLRQFLLTPSLRHTSIAALMNACGLLACGQTAKDYRLWCGESPQRTRRGC